MKEINLTSSTSARVERMNIGVPAAPSMSRSLTVEKEISDPSSALPKGERYPIPAFFEYRIRARDHDPL